VALARRVNILSGGVPEGEYERARRDGSRVRVDFVPAEQRALAGTASRPRRCVPYC
jgi:hypothetical protein